jgi:hypothetical protein
VTTTLLGVVCEDDETIAVGVGGAVVSFSSSAPSAPSAPPGAWRVVPSGTSEDLYAVASSAEVTVAVGGNLHIGGDSTILHRRRGTDEWSSEQSGMQHILLAIAPSGARGHAARWVAAGYNGGVVAGAPGAFAVLDVVHYQHVFALAAIDGRVFAAGLQGSVFELSGAAKQDHTTGLDAHLRALAATPEGTLYAAGLDGTIARWDGARWSRTPTPTRRHLEGLWMASDREGWAAGYAGALLRWDGGSWTAIDSGTSKNLHAIGGNTREVVAVGSEGIAVHLPR